MDTLSFVYDKTQFVWVFDKAVLDFQQSSSYAVSQLKGDGGGLGKAAVGQVFQVADLKTKGDLQVTPIQIEG